MKLNEAPETHIRRAAKVSLTAFFVLKDCFLKKNAVGYLKRVQQ